MMKRALAAASAALVVLASASTAVAAPPWEGPMALAEGLTTPLHLAAGPFGSVTVSEGVTSRLTTVAQVEIRTVYEAVGSDVGGVAYDGSTLVFVESRSAGQDPSPPVSSLKSIDPDGVVRTITDELARYAVDDDPAETVEYGLTGTDASDNLLCVAELEALGVPARYRDGDVEPDSHVVSVAVARATAYVADAGAGAVLTVDLRSGEIRSMTALPAMEVLFSEESARAWGMPSCVGLRYDFEGVPTDVEVGPDGRLFVSAVPGGAAERIAPPLGAVYRVDTATGVSELYADDLVTPTGIALDDAGGLYIASLFGPGILKVAHGGGEAGLYLPAYRAADVEVSRSRLFATTRVLGNGRVITERL
ncbi:ScyD/ScyE family protein [Tessaracoccus sp. G1721]